MGCRPWTPASDRQSGERRCSICGSAGFYGLRLPAVVCAAAGFVPLVFFRGRVEPGSSIVCLGCHEWGREQLVVSAAFRDLARHGHLDPIPKGAEDRPPELPEPARPAPHYQILRERWARENLHVQSPTVVSIPEDPMGQFNRLDSGDPAAPVPAAPPAQAAPLRPEDGGVSPAAPGAPSADAAQVAEAIRPEVEAMCRPHMDALRQAVPEGAQGLDWGKAGQYLVIAEDQLPKLVALVLETSRRLAAV